MKDIVDSQNLTITGAKPSGGVTLQDETIVIINQAYGPGGERLIGVSSVSFDGFPAITLKIRAAGREGLVHLSPIHGDRRKDGFTDIPAGTKCELMTPDGVALPKIGKVVEGGDAEYYAIYLSDRLERGPAIYVSDVWGHYHSRVVDNNELISAWAAAEEGVH
jgi:hypothetical protein